MELTCTIAPLSGADVSRTITVIRNYNLGSATRNPDSAKAHQDEVADAGVAIALDIPAPRIYPIAVEALTTGREVQVQCDRTSGEVEIVLVVADQLYVGVGSDHTDRILEKTSIPWSKQVCSNVLAPTLWPFEEVRGHWDDCILRSAVDDEPYQEVSVAAFLHPDDILAILRDRVRELPERDYLVFCGTYVSIGKVLKFGESWSFELEDPTSGRRIAHSYRVTNLFDGIEKAYRVPLTRT